MSQKPEIFISAVSNELKSARQLVATTLTFMGYQPVWQDIFGTEQGDLRAMLRRKLDSCQGLIQLTGQRFGYGPTNPTEDEQAVSYTQFELLHARDTGKKVWPVLLEEDFPVDAPNDEPPAHRENQRRYRQRLEKSGDLRYAAPDPNQLETIVLKLRQPLEDLRSEWEKERRRAARFRLMAGAAILALFVVGLASLQLSRATKQDTTATLKTVGAIEAATDDARAAAGQTAEGVKALDAKLTLVLNVLPLLRQEFATPRMKAGEALQTDGYAATGAQEKDKQLERIYAQLEEELKLPAGTLAAKLPGFAEELLRRPTTSTLDRAKALFAKNQFAEAEKEALKAKDEALTKDDPAAIVAALVLAGQSAEAQVEYDRANRHYLAASLQTSAEKDVLLWADVQNKLGWLYYLQGRGRESEPFLGAAWRACKAAGKGREPVALMSYHRWATSLFFANKKKEAETELRALISLREEVLGPEHRDTLLSRMNLASILNSLSMKTEAEAIYKEVIEAQRRILGPTHPETLKSRKGLASLLRDQRRYPEAEDQFQTVVNAQTQELGAQHPETLESLTDLWYVRCLNGRPVEAEVEHRRIYAIKEKVLGPEHPETLRSRTNFAFAMRRQGRNEEAEQVERDILQIKERLYGGNDIAALKSRTSIAHALLAAQKFTAAEKEYRDILQILERDHPEDGLIFSVHYHLAHALSADGRVQDAIPHAKLAAEISFRVLGAEDPVAKEYGDFYRSLTARQ